MKCAMGVTEWGGDDASMHRVLGGVVRYGVTGGFKWHGVFVRHFQQYQCNLLPILVAVVL